MKRIHIRVQERLKVARCSVYRNQVCKTIGDKLVLSGIRRAIRP